MKAHLTPSNQSTVRRQNRRHVLQCVIDADGTASRASIARETGLTSATVSSIVTELIDSKLVKNSGRASSTGGKPATSLRLRTDRLGIGALIVRRHTVRAAAVNLRGEVVWERPIHRSPSVVGISDIRAAVVGLLENQPLALLSIGVDTPGALNGGVILESVQMQLNATDLAAALADVTSVPIHLINDADADGLREFSLVGSEDRSLLSISIGLGIGAAIVIDGVLHRGPHSVAGEIGHVRVDFTPEAPLCNCGNRGCLEQFASLPVVLGLDADADYLLDSPGFDTDRLSERISEPGLAEKLDRSHRILAATIITICSTLDIATVAIGGDAPLLGESYVAGLRHYCELWQPVGSVPLQLRLTAGPLVMPFRGASEHALRQALDVTWG